MILINDRLLFLSIYSTSRHGLLERPITFNESYGTLRRASPSKDPIPKSGMHLAAPNSHRMYITYCYDGRKDINDDTQQLDRARTACQRVEF